MFSILFWGVPVKKNTLYQNKGDNNALCGYPIVKMEIRDSSQISTQHPFSCCLIISDKNIWRLPAAQLHFWIIFGYELKKTPCTKIRETTMQWRAFNDLKKMGALNPKTKCRKIKIMKKKNVSFLSKLWTGSLSSICLGSLKWIICSLPESWWNGHLTPYWNLSRNSFVLFILILSHILRSICTHLFISSKILNSHF